MRAMTVAGVSDAKAYLRDANENIVTLAMIETKTAIANLDAIAAVPGIDVLFVGPSDLSNGLSDGAELDPHSATVEAALDKIIAACRKAGKIAGLYCANAERAVACAKRGIRFLAVDSDLGFLRAGAAARIKTLKG
jgi:4-hydroxy-2-oxoheptanedioate aldolase